MTRGDDTIKLRMHLQIRGTLYPNYILVTVGIRKVLEQRQTSWAEITYLKSNQTIEPVLAVGDTVI